MTSSPRSRATLSRIARQAMLESGLQPDFPPDALSEAERLPDGPGPPRPGVRDLTALPWCSIDNDDSRDLDQLTVAEALPDGAVRVWVAIADVDGRVARGSAMDDHARANTTSVYTPAQVFAMLPERLSTNLTSLLPDRVRTAVVVEMRVSESGVCAEADVYPALVRNHAQLAYRGVGAWLEGHGPTPERVRAVPGLAENLQLQDRVAQALKTNRHAHGALELETIEVRARFEGDTVSGLDAEARNRAKELIEDFMIAANGEIARFLARHRMPVLRRVVRAPERWPRIVEIAAARGTTLPATPDAAALHRFMLARRAADPVRFPDLSLSIVKLLGRGEYEASMPGEPVNGHFGLAASEYTHSTAPNRRFPDLVTQRLIQAALAGAPVPYDRDALTAVALECTSKADAAQKVERKMRKAAAACLLSSRRGDTFDGIVTGASDKGTWVRIFSPPAEGRVEQGAAGLDVGDRVRVTLVDTDVERGFIDFARSGHVPATHPA